MICCFFVQIKDEIMRAKDPREIPKVLELHFPSWKIFVEVHHVPNDPVRLLHAAARLICTV
jgi:hypothetical protein